MFKMRYMVWVALLGMFGVLSVQATAEVKLEPIAPRLANANASKGGKIFLQCKACHLAEKGIGSTIGPNLWGIVNREVASQAGFAYTEALKSNGGVWNFETLSRYLFDPMTMVPGTRMAFPGVKEVQDRADLIAYLATLGDQPAPLPHAIPTPDRAAPSYGGLPDGEGREAVYFTCRACHALDQFTDQGLSREGWDELLTEMVRDNGMAAPESWARELMLDYLATHFGKKDGSDWEGLPPGSGREEVYYACRTCHSLMLVRQQGMSRERWDETLEWMVEEQGMNEFDDVAIRDRVLDYLSTHFGSG